MNFALIESLHTICTEADQSAQLILEAVADHPDRDVIIESADSVLGVLAAKLKAGKALTPAEVDEYAQLYASLSLLAQNSVRQGYNIDLNSPEGKAKFGRIVNNVGVDQAATDNVKRVASVNGQSQLKQVRNDLTNFPSMDPSKQQIYINQINKLRLSYERVKGQLGAPQGAAPGQRPAVPQAAAPAAPQAAPASSPI